MRKKTEKYVVESCFSETETALKILLLQNKSTFKRHIDNKTYQLYYILMTKYLLNIGKKNDEIKELIKRHIALTTYMYLSYRLDKKGTNKKTDEFKALCRMKGIKVDIFDSMLRNGFTIDDLSKNPEYYLCWKYYFDDLYYTKNHNEIKKCINNISSLYDYYFGKSDMIYGLLNNTLDYFYYGCKFADLKYYNHSDLLIAYNINSAKFHDFSFEVLDNSYEENYCSDVSYKQIDIKEKVLGHIINIIFINNNLELNKEMNVMPRYYYEIMFDITDKKILKDAYVFFEVVFEKQKAVIDTSKIKKSFPFKYNGKNYIFTKEGIINF